MLTLFARAALFTLPFLLMMAATVAFLSTTLAAGWTTIRPCFPQDMQTVNPGDVCYTHPFPSPTEPR